jgi:proteic killer suppression protein
MKFLGQATSVIFNGGGTQAARRLLPAELHVKAARLLDRLNAATEPNDLRIPPGSRPEKLQGGEPWSLRINDQYRIVFEWTEGEATWVEIKDSHSCSEERV